MNAHPHGSSSQINVGWENNRTGRAVMPRRSSRKRAVMILNSLRDNRFIHPLPDAEQWRSNALCGEFQNTLIPHTKARKNVPPARLNHHLPIESLISHLDISKTYSPFPKGPSLSISPSPGTC